MVLWQFITVTALVGALVVLAGVIARKLGLANARLTRIEEALLARSLPIDAADLSAAEAKPEVPGEKEVRGPYLTLRDLRARSEQLSSPASASSGWNCVTERGEAPTTTSGEQPGLERPPVLATDSEPLSLPTLEPVSEAVAPASMESPDVPIPGSEPPNPPNMEPVSEESAATILESPAAAVPNNEQRSPAADPPSSDEDVANKERETALLLSNQRRRRRARLRF